MDAALKDSRLQAGRDGGVLMQRIVSLRRYHEKQIRIHRDVLQSAGLKRWRAWSKRQIKQHEQWLEIISSIKPRSAG